MPAKKRSDYAREILREEMGTARRGRRADRAVIGALSVAWALFQLALPRFIILDSITVRAVHLSFAIGLVFLTIPSRKKGPRRSAGVLEVIPVYDYALAALAAAAVLYLSLIHI